MTKVWIVTSGVSHDGYGAHGPAYSREWLADYHAYKAMPVMLNPYTPPKWEGDAWGNSHPYCWDIAHVAAWEVTP